MKLAVISVIRSPWGGSEELWASLAREALKAGHEIYLSALDCGTLHPKMQQLISEGVKVTYRKKVTRNLLIRGWYFLQQRLQGTFHKVLRHQPDIVIYNGTCYSIAEDRKLLKELQKGRSRFFIIAHYNPDAYRPITDAAAEIIRQAYTKAEKIFFVSQRNLETAQRHLCCTVSNAVLVRNPVNMEDKSPVPYPAGDTMQLAMVGNLVTIHKGQDLALAVLARPEWRQRSWHLNIYGDGMDEAWLRSLTAFYGLQEKVTFHGRVSDIRALWAANHLLLMPSLMEGMPLAVVEAMICARPCVVTDVGGHKEWISEGEEGFIAEGAAIDAISSAMERAWQARGQWAAMGQAAHRKAMSMFDPQPGSTLLDLLLKNERK
jgi:glycosyltransferase involved in cell wall biosynthesis